LTIAGFDWTVWNANRSLAGLATGTQLGTATVRVNGQVFQEQLIKVGDSSAGSLILEMLDKEDESDLIANLTVAPAEGTVTGLQFAYQPSPEVTAPAAVAQSYQLEINLTGLPVQVGLDGSPGVSWAADIRSCPPEGSGESTAIHVIISE
jgi:hypothetical protein